MFAQVHTPPLLTPAELDNYLAKGWFRMGQTIFTTNFLRVKDEIHSTIWLRIGLGKYEGDSVQRKLFKKNSGFRTTIGPANVTDEKENLYSSYKDSIPFLASSSLHQLLFGTSQLSIYNTYEVTVHDGDKLIGCGFFDLGEVAAQGIVSFYDPSYSKYSLGKYIIYSKIQYCKGLQRQYFYPGYFVPGNPYFDYKLTIGRATLQFFSVTLQRWLPIDAFSKEYIIVEMMKEKLEQLQAIVTSSGLESHILKNDFFDVNLMPQLRDTGLFDFPVFLFFGPVTEDSIDPIIIFDPRDNLYHLLECIPVWQPVEPNPDKTFYSLYFLKSHEIDVHSTAEEIAARYFVVRRIAEEGTL